MPSCLAGFTKDYNKIYTMFDILIYLFESYFNAGDYPEMDHLSRKLTAAGFENADIHEALSWLSSLHPEETQRYPAQLQHSGVRHFAEIEKKHLSLDARQYLLFAERQGMIHAAEREMIIDRAMALHSHNLSVDNLKLIMLMILWSRQPQLDALLAEELLSPISSTPVH